MKDLPEELWLKIFLDIQSSLHPESYLAALCRVSSKFRRIAQPLLYQFLDGECNQFSSLFFRTLCSRPDLGRLARSLDIGSYTAEPEEAVCNVFKAARGTLGLPTEFESSIMKGLEQGVTESQIALALVLVPNIVHLDLTVPHDKDHIQAVFDMARDCLTIPTEMLPNEGNIVSNLTPPKIFSRLTDMVLRHWDTENAIAMWTIPQIFGFPTLETFCGFATDWCGVMPIELEGRRLKLKEITLELSLIDAEGLSSLLHLCPDLQSLEIEWGTALVGDCTLDFEAMGEVLRRQGTDLQALSLDPRDSFEYEFADATGRIGSLQALRKLKRLEVPLDVLIGKEESDPEDGDAGDPPLHLCQVLPASLEFLHIYSVEEDNGRKPHLHDLIASGYPPTLRKIEIDFTETGSQLAIEKFGWAVKNKRRTIFTKTSV